VAPKSIQITQKQISVPSCVPWNLARPLPFMSMSGRIRAGMLPFGWFCVVVYREPYCGSQRYRVGSRLTPGLLAACRSMSHQLLRSAESLVTY